MDKDNAILILENLKKKLKKDDFFKLTDPKNWGRDAHNIVKDWKKSICTILEELFESSFEEKKKEIQNLTLTLASTQNIKNEDINAQRIKAQEENLIIWRNKAYNLISDYIESIKLNEGLEANGVIKKLTEQLETANQQIDLLNKDIQAQKEIFELEIKQKDKKIDELEKKIPKTTWQKYKSDLAFWLGFSALLISSFQLGNSSGYDKGTIKFDKEKIELFKKVDTLESKNKHLQMKNKQLKISFDSLKKLNTDKK